MPDRCPTCDSHNPKWHPAIQDGGEVQPCRDIWHLHKELADHQWRCRYCRGGLPCIDVSLIKDRHTELMEMAGYGAEGCEA